MTRPGARPLERDELRGEDLVGDEADPRHQRPEERAFPPVPRPGPSVAASAPRTGKGASAGRSGWPMGQMWS